MGSNTLKQIRGAILLVGFGAIFVLFAARRILPLEWQPLHGVLALVLLALTCGSIMVFNKIATGKCLPGVPARAVPSPSELARNDRDRRLSFATALAIGGVGLVSFVLTKELHWSRSVSIVICICLISAIVLVSHRLRMQNIRRPS